MIKADRIGLLGGTFDPIHLGHLAAAEAARDALGLHEVVLLPSHVPPHRPHPGASAHHRFAMIAIAIDGREGLRASDLELIAPGPSFTSATLRRMHALGYTASQLFFITGVDAFAEIATWRDYPHFLDDASFVVMGRAGRVAGSVGEAVPGLADRLQTVSTEPEIRSTPAIFLVDRPTPDISSTVVRARSAAGLPLTDLVPPAVERHIRRHHLYASNREQPTTTPSASLLHEQEHR
jgi:nicotinate-nucleotide adenylyltransferase